MNLKITTGKEIMRIIVVSIVAAIILWIFGSIVNAFKLESTSGLIVVAVISLGLFLWSKKIRPGAEIGIVEFIPVFIVMGLLWGLGLPKIELAETTATWGAKFASLMASIYLGDTIFMKYILKK